MAKTFYVPNKTGSSFLTGKPVKVYAPNKVGNAFQTAKAVKMYCPDSNLTKLFWGSKKDTGWRQEKNIPYSFHNGSAVVFQNKIHLLGGESSKNAHYTFDGTNWTQLTNLPFDFYEGSAITVGGKIHCIGGASYQAQYYTYDGTTWTHEADLPDTWQGSFNHVYLLILGLNHAVESNNNLVLVGSNNGSNSNWRRVARLNNGSWNVNWYALDSSTVFYSSVAYKGLTYLFGDSGTGGTKYKIWDGASLSDFYNMPFNFVHGYALEYDGEIHILGGSGATNKHYSFNGTTFTECDDVPYNSFVKCPAVVFNDRIHIFGASGGSVQHWSYGEKATLIIESTLYSSANVNSTGVVAVTNGSRSPISKANSGYSVTFATKNGGGDAWIYTCCIALSSEAAQLDAPNEGLNISKHTIDGIDYYFSLHTGMRYQDGATEISSPINIPIFDDLFVCNPNRSPTTERVEEIIDLLGIVVH